MNATFEVRGNSPFDLHGRKEFSPDGTKHKISVMHEEPQLGHPAGVALAITTRQRPNYEPPGTMPGPNTPILPQPVDERDSKAVFYGPHPCQVCGQLIVKVAYAQGGAEFDAPDGPIYPNTRWIAHDHRAGTNALDSPDPMPQIVVFSCLMRPSHARAVASAILSAATEARD